MSRVCVKVSNLRNLYGPDMDLIKWQEIPGNVYCGRGGRIFVIRNGEKVCVGYKASPFGNPYNLKDYTLAESLRLYEIHLGKLIKDRKVDLEQLRGKKLGCWCEMGSRCHVDVIISLLGA